MATVMEAPGQVCHELNSSCKGSPLLVVILHELNRECPVSQAHLDRRRMLSYTPGL